MRMRQGSTRMGMSARGGKLQSHLVKMKSEARVPGQMFCRDPKIM